VKKDVSFRINICFFFVADTLNAESDRADFF
jgi:hypothetical protein